MALPISLSLIPSWEDRDCLLPLCLPPACVGPHMDRCSVAHPSTSPSSWTDSPFSLLPSWAHHTYGVAIGTLQFEVAVELVWGRTLALHFRADMEGATPVTIFSAVDDVAPGYLSTRMKEEMTSHLPTVLKILPK
jgi:hypothetical protein